MIHVGGAWKMSEGHVVRVRQHSGPPAALGPTGECYLLIDSERRIFSREILGVHGSLHHHHHHGHNPPGILGLMGRKLMEQFLAVYPKKKMKHKFA